ncbi:DUF4198 domain-containing protein [Pseudoxanthomonas wuyuanensis]|uniref:Uncharacterized conserved protein, contains GH25 family domain n=1 Tax=Pseudoxanthomonas wuyuanensis TaxID=1073196 RepID=A0A286D1V5_9GAMM|nr:DUF4198 domain-containing protein [Pseudoxanthomonas wuyuanensis]KAF1723200.1 DUF4198 domain-containing protein [Pseudoxanthomonas wuyuanensis]SOD52638.1 Uncharacterized conserved protein, contains GH25 family domain [Pseudoxanthomonas wuyuanensis]
MKTAVLLAALLGLLAVDTASAHTPYLAPASFEPMHGGMVTLDAAFGEEFFVPEVAFDHSEFRVTAPDGSTAPIDNVQRLKTRAVLEHHLAAGKGTYRFSTGPRLGAIFRTWEVDGKQESSRDPAKPLPPGARLLAHYQSLSVSEAYITAGAPTQPALKPYGKGLELVALTHPSDLYVTENFEFRIDYNGKPLAGQIVEIFRASGDRASQKPVATLTTDPQGKASFALESEGVYLALIRYRGKAPDGAAAPMHGYNYTLSFRVLEQ